MSDVITAYDPPGLSDAKLAELLPTKPLLIYNNLKGNKVSVAKVKKVKGDTLEITRQGVRDGVDTYKAGATTPRTRLVPVLALIEVDLINKLEISYAALEMGARALAKDKEPTVEAPSCVGATPVETEEEAMEAVGEVLGTCSLEVPIAPLEPGVAADGGLVDFDPEVHVVPQ